MVTRFGVSNDLMLADMANIPISPAKTFISINSSSPVSKNDEGNPPADTTSGLAPPFAKSPLTIATPSPLIKDLLQNLSSDLSKIIQSKDETIEALFIECEVTRRNALKAENILLQEKAKILQRAGYDNANSTARILELHLHAKTLEKEKETLALTSQAQGFQLKKDIIDLRGWKSEAESIVEGLHKELREAKVDFEKKLAVKESLLEQANSKAMEDRQTLESRDRKIVKLSNEVEEQNRENNELLGELQDLKTRMGGYKRTWEEFRDNMEESLWVDEHRGKKVSPPKH